MNTVVFGSKPLALTVTVVGDVVDKFSYGVTVTCDSAETVELLANKKTATRAANINAIRSLGNL
jgi:hypothetical protein